MKTRCSNRSFNMVSMEHWTVSLIFWLGLSPHSWLVCFLTEIGKVKYMILWVKLENEQEDHLQVISMLLWCPWKATLNILHLLWNFQGGQFWKALVQCVLARGMVLTPGRISQVMPNGKLWFGLHMNGTFGVASQLAESLRFQGWQHWIAHWITCTANIWDLTNTNLLAYSTCCAITSCLCLLSPIWRLYGKECKSCINNLELWTDTGFSIALQCSKSSLELWSWEAKQLRSRVWAWWCWSCGSSTTIQVLKCTEWPWLCWSWMSGWKLFWQTTSRSTICHQWLQRNSKLQHFRWGTSTTSLPTTLMGKMACQVSAMWQQNFTWSCIVPNTVVCWTLDWSGVFLVKTTCTLWKAWASSAAKAFNPKMFALKWCSTGAWEWTSSLKRCEEKSFQLSRITFFTGRITFSTGRITFSTGRIIFFLNTFVFQRVKKR